MSGAPRVLRSLGQLVASELAIKVFSLAFFMLLARRAGAEGLGSWTYAFTFVSLFLYLFNFALGTLYTREAAARPGAAQELLDRYLPLRLALLGAGIALLVPAACLLHRQASPWLVLVFGASLAMGMLGELFRAVFRARQRMGYEAGLNFLERAGSALLGAGALLLGFRLVGVAAAWSVGALAAALAAVALARRAGIRWPQRFELRDSSAVLRQALPLVLLGVFGSIYFRQDVLLLRWLRTEREVGLYGAAYRLFEMFVFLPGSLSLAYLPAAAAARSESLESLRKLFRRAMALSFSLGCPLALMAAFRTDEAVRLLFGAGFAESVPAAQVLVWTLPLYFANTVVRSTLIVGRPRLPAVAVAAAIVANAALNLAWIPRMGITGAAWATLLTEVFLFLLQGVFVLRDLRVADLVAPLGPPVLACAGLAGVLWFGRGLSLWPALAVGAVAYAVLGTALRLWTPEEWRALLPGGLRPESLPVAPGTQGGGMGR
ncbi:MAG: flippase [Candidatus Eisenbacteria bacterium]|nr:flippase [Candidatus Eisenbacteria bacterium]